MKVPPKPLPTVTVLGRAYYRGGEAACLDWLLARERRPRAVHVANVHTAVTAFWDAELDRAQAEAALNLADGRPLSLAAKLLGCWEAKQLRGPDLMLSAAKAGRRGGRRHYFYGGVDGVAAAVASRLRREAPGLRVAGAVSPPFRPLGDAELKRLIARLKAAQVDILWVGLGAPKQEKFMARMARLGAPCAMVGVGAGFDYYAGRKREAPKWMQQLALEWLFRLVSEPRRLWWRYLSTNAPFLGLLGLEYAGLLPRSRQAPWVRALRAGSMAAALACLALGRPGAALACAALPLLWGRLAWRTGAQA